MNITTTRNHFTAQYGVALTLLALVVGGFFAFVSDAYGASGGGSASPAPADTVWLQIDKRISPDSFEGSLDADDFSFHITGSGVNKTISHGEVVELPVGTYDVIESYNGSDPVGFDPEDWTAYWVGDMCEGPADVRATEPGTIVVEESDIGKYPESNPGKCNAENQYKPVVDETDTTEIIIEKKLSGPYPEGSRASDFTFSVESIDPAVTVSGDADDYASAIIELGVGEYSIEEIMPEGYVLANWTTQWSGPACENIGNALGTTIVVEAGDIGKDNFSCRADNVYEANTTEICEDPAALNTGEVGPCEYDAHATSTVTVIKELVGTTTSPTQFSFRLNGGRSIGFEEDGSNIIEVPAGDYEIEEVSATGYTIATSSDCSGTIGTGEQRTCTITNTWPNGSTTDNGGGDNGNGDADAYRIEGYVWHDNNENSEWDGFQDDAASTTEESQAGWTVKITNGTDTHSTTTDANGYYFFEVPAGTWTITETVMEGWDIITPADNAHEVTVPATTTAQTLGDRIFAFFMPTAHAAVIGTFGPFNFGNNESETVTTGGGGGRSGGGGGTSRPRCTAFDIAGSGVVYTLSWETRSGSALFITQDGTEIFSTNDDDVVDAGDILVTTDDADFELTVNRGSREDTCIIETSAGGGSSDPGGEVLGEQVRVVPLGAAETGAGGAAPMQNGSFVQTLVLLLRDRFSFTTHAN